MPARFVESPRRPRPEVVPGLGRLALLAAPVGLVAGLVGATFASIAGEPSIERAIALEASVEGDDGLGAPTEAAETTDQARVSRSHQRGVGLFVAYALTGAAFGALLAITAHGLRRGRPDLPRRILLAGLILAGSLTVAPWLKYPPNPPGVADPSTLAQRQSLYVLLICIALTVGTTATILDRRLRQNSWADPSRAAVVAAAVVGPMLATYALLPAGPDASSVPASLVWSFRLASLGSNLVLWTVLSLALSWLVSADARTRSARPAAVLRWTDMLISKDSHIRI